MQKPAHDSTQQICCNSPKLETTQTSCNACMVKQIMIHLQHGILLSKKKEQTIGGFKGIMSEKRQFEKVTNCNLFEIT